MAKMRTILNETIEHFSPDPECLYELSRTELLVNNIIFYTTIPYIIPKNCPEMPPSILNWWKTRDVISRCCGIRKGILQKGTNTIMLTRCKNRINKEKNPPFCGCHTSNQPEVDDQEATWSVVPQNQDTGDPNCFDCIKSQTVFRTTISGREFRYCTQCQVYSMLTQTTRMTIATRVKPSENHLLVPHAEMPPGSG